MGLLIPATIYFHQGSPCHLKLNWQLHIKVKQHKDKINLPRKDRVNLGAARYMVLQDLVNQNLWAHVCFYLEVKSGSSWSCVVWVFLNNLYVTGPPGALLFDRDQRSHWKNHFNCCFVWVATLGIYCTDFLPQMLIQVKYPMPLIGHHIGNSSNINNIWEQ